MSMEPSGRRRMSWKTSCRMACGWVMWLSSGRRSANRGRHRPDAFVPAGRLCGHLDVSLRIPRLLLQNAAVQGGADLQFLFDDHVLDVDRRELRRAGEPIAIEPQVFDLLVHVGRNRDRVVSKDDLIAAIWHGRIVSESTLTSRINAVRKAVGDSGEEQRLIRTIARKGIRFVGEVSETAAQRATGAGARAPLAPTP